MATLTIRNLDDPLKLRLRLRAAMGNRSMEEEARQILRAALQDTAPTPVDIGARIRARFAGLGDVQLSIQPREPLRAPPALGKALTVPISKERAPRSAPEAARMNTLVDTNVLSELLRAAPDPGVLGWFAAQPAETLFVSAITQAEMMLGARVLPAGKRRSQLEAAVNAVFAEDFAGRILPFDSAAVPGYVDTVESRRRAGRPISQFDAQIAAIALLNGTRLATRNVSDFEGCGIALLNPWTPAT